MIARTSACKKTHRQLRVREQLSGALVGETSLVCKDCAKHKPTALPLKSTKAPIFSLEDWGGRWDLLLPLAFENRCFIKLLAFCMFF